MARLHYSKVMRKKVTMADIAREVALSKNTVSLALRNDPQIPESTRKRINACAERMGYQRNPVVAHLMAELRASAETNPTATLALINVNEDGQALASHPTIPTYVFGCKTRANRLGYGIDTFWLHDPELNSKRLHQILKARSIRGIILVGLMNQNQLPPDYGDIWNQYPCVVTGVRTRQPALPFACSDHHILTLRAFEKAIELGYRRPALVLDRTIDQLVEGRFTAGYQIGQNSIPRSQRIKPFYHVKEATQNPALFKNWLEQSNPDVIFTLYNVVRTWLQQCHKKIPEDIGLIQLEWRTDHPEFAGMNQHNDRVGEAAVDMVVSMIHNGEYGVPAYPRATLIGPTWVHGSTVRDASLD